jgi:hypothetical protein
MPEPVAALGLTVTRDGDRVELLARRVVHGVRVACTGAAASDDGFTLEPGQPKAVMLAGSRNEAVTVTALNLAGSIGA